VFLLGDARFAGSRKLNKPK